MRSSEKQRRIETYNAMLQHTPPLSFLPYIIPSLDTFLSLRLIAHFHTNSCSQIIPCIYFHNRKMIQKHSKAGSRPLSTDQTLLKPGRIAETGGEIARRAIAAEPCTNNAYCTFDTQSGWSTFIRPQSRRTQYMYASSVALITTGQGPILLGNT